ncbi:Pyruvate, phosphate dikinase [Dirofilaria immitis]
MSSNRRKDRSDSETGIQASGSFGMKDGKLWILQTRSGKRTAEATVRIIIDMVSEGVITKGEGILGINPKILDGLLHPVPDIKSDQKIIGKGLPASPDVASSRVENTNNISKTHEMGPFLDNENP